ncbi:unnamed protein product [Closterium sp. Yama58-4]|nr:unnamed protein product [Closterium sp. Yama58-4]
MSVADTSAAKIRVADAFAETIAATAESAQAVEMGEPRHAAETDEFPRLTEAATPPPAVALAESLEASATELPPGTDRIQGQGSSSVGDKDQAGNPGDRDEARNLSGEERLDPAQPVTTAPSSSSSNAAILAPKGPITDACNGQDAANTSARHRELVDATGQLLFLASRGIIEGVIDLLDRGVSPDLADYDGRTALHLAASEGKVDVVRVLLERGADVNPKDRHGNTPLADAQSYGSGEICRLLKEKGGMLCEIVTPPPPPPSQSPPLLHSAFPLLSLRAPFPPSLPRILSPPLPLPFPPSHSPPSSSRQSARIRNAGASSFNQQDYEIDGSEINLGTSKVIGEGSFGEVRLASWRGTPIAVKVLRDEYAADPAALNEFRQELRILQSLRHPNIVQFLGAVTKSRPRMIVTEYLKVNLRDVIRKKGALPAHEALRYALDVARGMCYLHAHRPDPVIHRDLTPSNLLRDDSGHLKVADFGLASIRATAAAPTTPSMPTASGLGLGMGMGMGSTNIVSLFQPNFSRRLTFSKHSHRLYSAPELLAQQEYDKSVDVYSFGVILFEMLEGYDRIRQLLPGGTNHGGNLFPLALSGSGHSFTEGGAEGGAGGSHHSGGGSYHGGGSLRGGGFFKGGSAAVENREIVGSGSGADGDGADGDGAAGGGAAAGGGGADGRGSEGEAAPEAARPPDIVPIFTRRTYPVGMKELITDCWNGDPAARPSFARIIEILEQIQEGMHQSGKKSNANASGPACCTVL